jgi:hypothetical protein
VIWISPPLRRHFLYILYRVVFSTSQL